MIERQFVASKIREFQVEEFIFEHLKRVGHSHTKIQRTPLGEKIIIYSSRPGLIIGRKGTNIKDLTQVLKEKFNFDNPQIEISEVENVNLDPQLVAERIATTMERFGKQGFKGAGHKAMDSIMQAGALGVEIILSGKIPSARARNWRFYQGYLKKAGDVAFTGVKTAYAQAQLKSGIIGIKVKIMPPDTQLPDKVKLEELVKVVEEITDKEEKAKIEAEIAEATRQEKAEEQSKGPEEKETAQQKPKEATDDTQKAEETDVPAEKEDATKESETEELTEDKEK